MSTVFVDVDDTLIIYEGIGTHHYGVIYGEPYVPNEKLIEKLKRFTGNIVIWSGGGRGYARDVAKEVLPKGMQYVVQSKHFDSGIKPKAGDIIIDDQIEYLISMREWNIHIFRPFDDWDTDEHN